MILEVIFGVVVFLILFYYFMIWKFKNQLNKLKEGYDGTDNKSRKSDDGFRNSTVNRTVAQREQPIQRVEQLERRTVLPITNDFPTEPVEPEFESTESFFGKLFKRKRKVSADIF